MVNCARGKNVRDFHNQRSLLKIFRTRVWEIFEESTEFTKPPPLFTVSSKPGQDTSHELKECTGTVEEGLTQVQTP